MQWMRTVRLWTLCVGLVIGLITGVAAQETTIFQESFESPDITGLVDIQAPGWSAPEGRGYQAEEADYALDTPYGTQVAAVFLHGSTPYRIETTGITDTLQTDTIYRLSFNVGNINFDNGTSGTVEYTAELLAGTTVVASAVGDCTTSDMTESDSCFIATMGTHPNLGETLSVRVKMTSGNWQCKALFDNVKLTTEPNTNQVPVANVGSDINTPVAEVQLDGSASSDPDGDPLTYEWTSDCGAVFNPSPYVASPVAMLGGSGVRSGTFTLTVTDTLMASHSDTMTVNVTDAVGGTVFFDSFESPIVTGRVQTAIPGWTHDTSQTYGDRVGLWNEDSGTMTTPYGDQSAYIWSERTITTTGITATLQADTVYILTFNAAAESGQGNISFDAELLAGTTVVASTSSGNVLATSDHSVAGSLVFTAMTGHPNLNETLGIRFRYASGDWHYVMSIDNVKLAYRTLSAVHVWNGQGADENFSTAANWSTVTVPGGDDLALFDATSAKNCIIDSDITVGSLQVDGAYAGVIGVGTNSITIKREFIAIGGTGFSADAGTIKFSSGSDQQLVASDGAVLYNLENSKSGGTLSVSVSDPNHLTLSQVTLNALRLNPGTETQSAGLGLMNAVSLDMTGTDTDHIVLTGLPISLDAAATAAYGEFRHVDAGRGSPIFAGTTSVDNGSNINVAFEAPPAWDGVDIPPTSAVSPLCLQEMSMATIPEVSTDGVNFYQPTVLTKEFWFTNVNLSPTAATSITVKYGTELTKQQDVSWSSTDIAGTSSMLIRKDDSLLLTMAGTGTTLEIDADYDGVTFTPDFTGAPGDTFAYQYSTAKIYTSAARIDSGTIETVQVTAATVDLRSNRLGLWLNNDIPRTVTVTPAAALSNVWVDAVDSSYLTVSTKTTGSDHIIYNLEALHLTAPKILIAKLTDQDGAILGYKEGQAFTLSHTNLIELPVMKTYSNGDQFIAGGVRMRPHYDDVYVRVYCISGGTVAEDGSNENILYSSSFDQHGQKPFYFIKSPASDVCHMFGITEGE